MHAFLYISTQFLIEGSNAKAYLALNVIKGKHAVRVAALCFDGGTALSGSAGAESRADDAHGTAKTGGSGCGHALPVPGVHAY